MKEIVGFQRSSGVVHTSWRRVINDQPLFSIIIQPRPPFCCCWSPFLSLKKIKGVRFYDIGQRFTAAILWTTSTPFCHFEERMRAAENYDKSLKRSASRRRSTAVLTVILSCHICVCCFSFRKMLFRKELFSLYILNVFVVFVWF